MKTLAIIGGGVSGITAGIYGQKSGLECTIYEQHNIVGGELTGWDRNGCHIDNCVHWMTGTARNSEIFNVWCEVNALQHNGGDIIQNEAFLRVDTSDGHSLNLWQDLEKLKSDMILISPEDKELTETFIRQVKAYRCVEIPAKKPLEQMSLREKYNSLQKMKGVIKYHKKCREISIAEYVSQFKSKAIREMLTAYFPPQYNISSLMYVLAIFSNGNAALPKGGSLAMAQRMVQRFHELGGKTICNAKAIKIEIDKKKATKIIFADNKEIVADYIICACDTYITFNKLIGIKYMDKIFRLWYMWHNKYPVHSSINFYFEVADNCIDIPDTLQFECSPYIIAGETKCSILMKNYNSEPQFAPDGHTIIQTLTLQYSKEFEFWNRLRKSNLKLYKEEKERIAKELIERIEQKFIYLKGKIKYIESVTPASFNRYCGAYKGAYMSFILTPFVPKITHKGIIKDIKNLYLASQWLQPPGGLPNALLSGKFAIQRLCKKENIKFKGYGE